MRSEKATADRPSVHEPWGYARGGLRIFPGLWVLLFLLTATVGRGADALPSDDARIRALAGADEAAVRAAADELVQAGEVALPALVELLDTGGSDPAGMAWKTLFRIVQQADTEAKRQAVARVLFDEFEARPGAAVRNKILELLSFVGDQETVDGLYKYLGYPDVQEMVRWALVRIPAYNATQALVAGMQITEWDFRIALVQALGERGDPRAAPALRMLTASDDERMRATAMAALARLPDRLAVFALGQAWEARKPGATRMLSRLGETLADADLPNEARGLFRILAKSSELSAIEFCAVAHGLGRVGEVEDARRLLAALDDGARWGNQRARVHGAILAALEQIDDPAAAEGFVTYWWLAGPVPIPGGEAWDDCAIDPAEVVTTAPARVADTDYAWRRHHTADPRGVVDLGGGLGVRDEAAAYAYTELIAKEDQEAWLQVGSEDVVVVWLNGRRVHARRAEGDPNSGENRAKVALAAGVNRLLVKAVNEREGCAFSVRLLTPEGTPAPVAQRWW